MRLALALVLLPLALGLPGCGGCPRTRASHVRASAHAAAADITVEEPIVVAVTAGSPLLSELDEAAIHAVAESQASDIGHCFEAARAEHPALDGAVAVDLAIGADGVVRAAAIAENETGDGVLGVCVLALVERWHFPASLHGARVRLPFAATDPPPEPQASDPSADAGTAADAVAPAE